MKNKKDLIIVALFQLIRQNQDKANAYAEELEEYLRGHYTKKNKDSWDYSSIIWDSIFGNEGDSFGDFEANLKNNAIRKK